MELGSLRDLFVEELKDLYSAESQLVKAIPKLAKAAENEDLRHAFEQHLEKTKGHAQRIEQIFERLDKSPKGKRCVGMEGLIEEGSEMLEKDADPNTLDAALILAAQKVEHYEIASYGSVCAYAETLGERQAFDLLTQTLEEEKQADETLTGLAQGIVNVQASQGNGGNGQQAKAMVRSDRGSRPIARRQTGPSARRTTRRK
jgi:ferritin-like metal-binding protein YciE